MSSGEYWTEKTVSWNGVNAGLAIWIFALGALLLAEAAVCMTATSAKADSVDLRRPEPAIADVQAEKEYYLQNCLHCE